MTVWPLVVYFVAVILVVAGMLAVSYVLGQRHREPATGAPYESGILSLGDRGSRTGLGWAGYCEALIFIGVLVATLAYLSTLAHLWRVGALDWFPAGPRAEETI